MDKEKVYLIGNAHLDPVWLWRWQEGFAEIKATFRSALDRMKEYDDFKFTSACSSYYMWIEKSDKAMFEEIRQRVAEGRWCIVGGWFVQPDCNLPSGESFARHGLISQRYFKEKFGKMAKVGYNVDSFGHNGSIPKILKNSGMDSYVFMRPMKWEKELPKSLFWWESNDGSRVPAYRIPRAYNLITEWFDVFGEIDNMNEGVPQMAFYGVGNHGGGATVELLDKMHAELGENFVFSTPEEYFESVSEMDIPTIADDLQYHAKGCYSVNSKMKNLNRMAENKLCEAEIYSVLSKELMDTEYPAQELDRGWKNVLFNQFHDILAGCCVEEAHKDAEWSYGETMNITAQVSNFALQQISWNIDTSKGIDIAAEKKGFYWINQCVEGLGIPLVIFNSLPYEVERAVLINCPAKEIKTDDGENVPVQWIRAQKTFDAYTDYNSDTVFMAKIPAMGYSVYRIHTEGEKKEAESNPFICTENSIENEEIKLTLNPKTGEVSSIFIKDSKKELLSGETETYFVDETDSDTWAHAIVEFKNLVAKSFSGSVRLKESGPVRAVLESKIKLLDTEITRDYIIEQGSSVVTVKATVDFREEHKMLKFSFPANGKNPKAFAKIPFGSIERPADGNEQVCGEWVTLGDVVVANGDKPSFDADGNVLNMTVLRGALYADHSNGHPEYRDGGTYIEKGIHHFEYNISEFESVSKAEKTSQRIMNIPTVITETFHKGKLSREFSGISVSAENVIVTAVKKHTDSDGYVLRCYEAEGKNTEVKFTLFGTDWTANIGANQVKTFIVSDGKVKETDFLEW